MIKDCTLSDLTLVLRILIVTKAYVISLLHILLNKEAPVLRYTRKC